MTESNETGNLIFYSSHDVARNPRLVDCFAYKFNNKIKYPCVILIRDNGWNDYSCYTHFAAFYLKNDADIISLGTVKIIQAKPQDFRTTLPNQFQELPKGEFFSRGTLTFYKSIQSDEKLKNAILSALNDIHFHRYTKEEICAISGALEYAYTNSLFRSDMTDLDVSSEYAKYSLDSLSKISDCLTSIGEIEGSQKKILTKLLYGSAITALESYLGDGFKYKITNNRKYYDSFLKNYNFKYEKKYELRELGLMGNLQSFVEGRVNEILNDIIFHRIALVKKLYNVVLKVELPSELMDFEEAIQKRHDIFHRNGKNIAGMDLDIQEHEINILVEKIRKFISATEKIMSAQT